MAQNPKIELHKGTKNLLDDTQARILISGNGKWSHDQIIKTALEKLREELKLEDKEADHDA